MGPEYFLYYYLWVHWKARYILFSETEAKDLPHRLIKHKRIAQLINEKPGENQYRPTTCELLKEHATL